MISQPSRRTFLQSLGAAATVASLAPGAALAAPLKGANMAYGLVTYQWGKDWDLPTLIKNCEQAKVYGVELRTTHAHGVEPTLSKIQREEVVKRFNDSPVQLVSLGSNERFDSPDPAVLKKAIETSKEFLRLAHDVGATGVKVKPDRFYPTVAHEKTIAQIGGALNELGEYATGFGQQVRLEVHGQCGEPATIKKIMDVADNENVAVCWNSNAQDLEGPGLEQNFNLLIKRFGATCHVRPLDDADYPYAQLIQLLVDADYQGWLMLEDGRMVADPVEQLARQAILFKKMVAAAQSK
ncbi:sugar phosphate isomerase/epimerase family protein [Lignipirellula cremea]|uniref:Xylose isomerase-like TIM barrel n=1 Tax=Lignipirellula cremea TaxID=2528010 RepID=A0A518DX81_9BACT|nr:TIM barrel protein [Lignipirellula cremea]QDU96430.1 Xylose isomerase-like TIM barrel [Lignipirellula cremea]